MSAHEEGSLIRRINELFRQACAYSFIRSSLMISLICAITASSKLESLLKGARLSAVDDAALPEAPGHLGGCARDDCQGQILSAVGNRPSEDPVLHQEPDPFDRVARHPRLRCQPVQAAWSDSRHVYCFFLLSKVFQGLPKPA